MFLRGKSLPERGTIGGGRLPVRAVAPPRADPAPCWPPRPRSSGCSASARLAPGDHQHARLRRDLPVVRGAHRLRRPDLARPDGARGHGRLRAVQVLQRLALPARPARRRRWSRRCSGWPRRARAPRARRQPGDRHARRGGRDRGARVQEPEAGRLDRRPRGAATQDRREGLRAEQRQAQGLRHPGHRRGATQRLVRRVLPDRRACCWRCVVVNLRRSATGRRFLAVRGNERAAAAAGVNVAGTKLLAFGLSAFIAGIGGALSATASGR